MNNTFGIPLVPANERERLEKLYSYNILHDYDKAGAFKHVAAMAAHIFKVPVALVVFVDEEQTFFAGNFGMEDADRMSRGESLCSLAILKDEVTIFEDANADPCLLANPLVSGDFGLRFYAAAPLITPEGYKVGTVCIVDKKPRKLSVADKRLLEALASSVIEELEERQLSTCGC